MDNLRWFQTRCMWMHCCSILNGRKIIDEFLCWRLCRQRLPNSQTIPLCPTERIYFVNWLDWIELLHYQYQNCWRVWTSKINAVNGTKKVNGKEDDETNYKIISNIVACAFFRRHNNSGTQNANWFQLYCVKFMHGIILCLLFNPFDMRDKREQSV